MLAKQIELDDALLNVSLCINGQVHLVAMDKDKLDLITLMVKRSAGFLYKTDRSQQELLKFLGLEE